MTFGSLFAGIGGFDLGLERAGWTCNWQVEMDDDARRVLARHWPDVPRFGDVRSFPGRIRLPRRYYGVDLICGGDPCQENSGQRIAGGCSQPSLGGEFLRVVAELRPRFVLRENPTRVRPDAPWPWWRFAGGLRGLGYDVLPFRIRACCLGLDHRRDRLYLLAGLPDADGQHAQLRPRSAQARFAPGAAESSRQEREWLRAQSGPALRDPRNPVHGSATRDLDGLPARVDGRRLRGYGNAVPPAVAEWIGRRLMASFTEAAS